jgi:PAS domain S-box-containing protein
MQDLIKHLPVVIYEYAIDPHGEERFNFIGGSCKAILGLKQDSLLADPGKIYSVFHTEDLAAFRQFFSKANNRAGQWRWSGRIGEDNSNWIEIQSNDEIDEAGVILRRGIIQKANTFEEASVAHETRYEDLLERLPLGVVINYQGTLVFANAHAHYIMGANNPRELIGRKIMDFIHPASQNDIKQRIEKVNEGKSVPMLEEKFIRIDGKLIDVETIAFPFIYKGQAAIQVIFRDITEKKYAEALSKKNETLFTQLFQNLPMAVVMLDDTGKVSQINKGFEEMFGFTEFELRGKNLNDFIVPEELRNEGIDLNNLITSNQVVSIESIRRHRSGKKVHVILCGVPVMLDKQTIGIYGVYVDISDRKHVEEELKIRNAELDNFVYKVSHDLRAPLSSVLGLVNLSRLEGNRDNPIQYLEIIGEKIQALDHFIGDVLSHAKNLKVDVHIGKVDLKGIIERTFIDLGYLEGAQNMKRSVKIEGIDFYSDYWRISEIFRNLISNAIKYRKPRVEGSEINIAINVDHLCADISFSDNGIGIKETSLKRIFEMFYRATEQSEGSGIGLYIVKNAVEKLGGQIQVASKPGEGTRFHILLPNINSIIKPLTSKHQNED